MDHTVLLAITSVPLPRKHSPDGASPDYPERMKG